MSAEFSTLQLRMTKESNTIYRVHYYGGHQWKHCLSWVGFYLNTPELVSWEVKFTFVFQDK